jgi:excisionase family DNA binding protein
MLLEPTIPQSLLSYRAASKILGCSDKTVWTLCKTGQLKAVRFGGNVRIDPADLQAFIERAKTAPAMTKRRRAGVIA